MEDFAQPRKSNFAAEIRRHRALPIFLSTNGIDRRYWDPEVGVNEDSVPTWAARGSEQYFNWYAATAGSGHYSTQSDTGSQIARDSICPSSWQMPNNSGSGSYANLLMTVYGYISETNANINSEAIKELRGNNLFRMIPKGYFMLNGSYAADGLHLWNNTEKNNGFARAVYVGSAIHTQDEYSDKKLNSQCVVFF